METYLQLLWSVGGHHMWWGGSAALWSRVWGLRWWCWCPRKRLRKYLPSLRLWSKSVDTSSKQTDQNNESAAFSEGEEAVKWNRKREILTEDERSAFRRNTHLCQRPASHLRSAHWSLIFCTNPLTEDLRRDKEIWRDASIHLMNEVSLKCGVIKHFFKSWHSFIQWKSW